MKVRKLIELLNKIDPDADVLMHGSGGKPVIFVAGLSKDRGVIWLESEDDCDLKAQIDAYYDNTNAEIDVDELDFYSELIDHGITADHVRRYRGDEDANHMIEFCEEHGLI